MPATDRGISPSVSANSQSNYDSIDQSDHRPEFVEFYQDEVKEEKNLADVNV